MSVTADQRHAPIRAPGRPPVKQRIHPPERALTPRVRRAIALMVDEGLSRKDAASQAGLTDHALYSAFCKPAVVAHFNKLLEVLRTGERARNLLTGVRLRDSAGSEKVQLEAAKWLHGESGPASVQVNVGVQVTPGYVLDLREEARGQMIELSAHEPKPLTDQPPVADE